MIFWHLDNLHIYDASFIYVTISNKKLQKKPGDGAPCCRCEGSESLPSIDIRVIIQKSKINLYCPFKKYFHLLGALPSRLLEYQAAAHLYK